VVAVGVTTPLTGTFLFTDLVDSTALSSRLGPDAAEELRQAHYGMLRSAAAATGANEVKSTGDGLMLMFTSPSRALACAVAIQQAIERHNRRGGEPLSVRVGLSMGEATEGEGDYYGDCVVEAARLCAAAAGGQILTTEVLRSVVGRHATQDFAPVGELELKGLPDPVPAVEVRWLPEATPGMVPLPGRVVGAATDALFGFFGRVPELDILTQIRKRAHAVNRCQAAFLAGEAGIGKTALVAQVSRAAHAEGSIVLFGHAEEDVGISYQPWIEIIRPLVRDDNLSLLSRLPSAQRAALARLLPELDDDGEGRVADPDAERLLLWEASMELVGAASQHAPVLVVLDDLHWADTATLQLLRHVIASANPMDVTIVCTYRDTDLRRADPLHKLLSDLHRETRVTRVALAGLEDHELVELMVAAAGHELDDTGIGLAHTLRRETDGNPFFTGEILRHLWETGRIVPRDDGRLVLADDLENLDLPSSVRDVVGRRVERLGDEAFRVLCLAAVIGREFDIELLAQVTNVDEDELLDVTDAAVSAAVLIETGTPGRYSFAHVLIQHTLYDEVSPTRRERAHHHIAEVLEARATAPDAAALAELAHHWVAATRPAEIDKALTYVRRAGDAARDALAPEDAIRWYQQALDLLARQTPTDLHQRAELLATLGTTQRQLSLPGSRETLLEAGGLAQQLGDTEALVQAALGFNTGSPGSQLVGDNDAKTTIQAALDATSTDPTPTRARLLAQFAIAHDATAEWRTRRDLAFQALDVARRADEDGTFVDVIDTAHLSLATPDHVEQHVRDVQAAVAIADRIGDPELQSRIRYPLLWTQYQQADIAGVDATLAEMQGLTEAVGLAMVRYAHAMLVTGRLLLAGRAADAEIANQEVLQIGTAADHPDTLGIYGGLLFAIRHHQGRINEISDLLIEAARDNPSIAALRSALPFMLCEIGRIDEATERLSTEASTGFDFPYDTTWLAAMGNVIDAAATTGDQAAARTLIQRVSPFADQVVAPAGPVVNGAIARPLARAATLLGDYQQAEHWFTTAHDLHARLQAPFWTALGQLDHADLCLARRADGDANRARQLATGAAATAAEYGCAALTARAASLLAAT
jgi:class 3 adenylate cyclase/tetratricopeptide (TPR) repeat protein